MGRYLELALGITGRWSFFTKNSVKGLSSSLFQSRAMAGYWLFSDVSALQRIRYLSAVAALECILIISMQQPSEILHQKRLFFSYRSILSRSLEGVYLA